MSDESAKPSAERRTDGATRAIVERLDKIELQLASMHARQESHVTFKGVLVGAGGILVVVLAIFGAVITRAEAAAKEAGREALAVASEAKATAKETALLLRTDLQDFRREMKADIGDLKSELRNTATSVRRDVKRAVVASDGGP